MPRADSGKAGGALSAAAGIPGGCPPEGLWAISLISPRAAGAVGQRWKLGPVHCFANDAPSVLRTEATCWVGQLVWFVMAN
jgi:hypothetical protein